MENWEKGKFEKEWSDAFREAEGTAPEAVWNNIDLSLQHAESSVMRRQVIFYQRLAAASVFFALLVGGGSLYYSNLNQSEAMATTSLVETKDEETSNTIKDNANTEIITEATTTGNRLASENQTTANPETKTTDDFSRRRNNKVSKTSHEDVATIALPDNSITASSVKTEDEHRAYAEMVRDRLTSYQNLAWEEPPATVKGSYQEKTIWRQLPAFPAEFMSNSKKTNKQEKLWASVGASAGSFNPNMNNSSASTASFQGASTPALSASGFSQSSNMGTAVSVGMGFGKKIGDHWVVQGGVNYLSQSLSYQSNLQSLGPNNEAKALVANYGFSDASTVQLTTPYDINSLNEIISIPVQAGYLILDRKFGIQLNTGVATDLFIRNTLTDRSGQLARNSESAGSNSPYRTVSWAGLFGSELSYKLADRYRISLVPGLRYSFNSVLKSESGTVSNPVVMDVGFRFRYIFK